MSEISQMRKNYRSWDEYYMGVALLSSYRSKDPSTQVGACIVDSNRRILSVGYNGTPNGMNDEAFNWSRQGDFLNSKYAYVIHAEPNAIMNFSGNTADLKGATIYVTLFPCNECAKLIVQSGIKKVVYLSDKYKDSDSTIASKQIFDGCGVEYEQFIPKNDSLTLNFK